MPQPMIVSFKPTLSQPVLDWAQAIADRAIERNAPNVVETEHDMLCVSRGAVIPHTDDLGGIVAGKTIVGLVIRSDGHRLHSDLMPQGHLLEAGDLYMIDPMDRHWTTVEGGAPDAQLIFSPHIMRLDQRSPKKLHRDISFELFVQYMDTIRPGIAARQYA